MVNSSTRTLKVYTLWLLHLIMHIHLRVFPLRAVNSLHFKLAL